MQPATSSDSSPPLPTLPDSVPAHLLLAGRQELARGRYSGQLARRIASVYWEMCAHWGELGCKMGAIVLQQMRAVHPPFDRSLEEALAALSRFTEQYRLLPDLISKDRLMMRRDGTLVFVDPLALRDD